MKTVVTFSILAVLVGFLPQSLEAGGGGFFSRSGQSCAVTKWSTPRYKQALPYRHYDDRRRYNAAPCWGQIGPEPVYLLKTVVVRKKYEPYYFCDGKGGRHCRKVLVVTYKDLYSDGSCHVYTTRG